jgi:RNA polymerase sigma factor (sigma-70 family)
MSNVMNRDWAGQFVTQRRKWLVIQAMTVCRNASDAEDLVQEASLRFIQRHAEILSPQNERSCEAWMVTTLTHLFYDQCRRKKVQAQGAQDPHLREEAVVTLEPPSEEIYDTLTDEQFAEALKVLSPKIRETFELHAAGKQYQDIARIQGIPVGTVAKRLHDARAKLREVLQRDTQSTPGTQGKVKP